MLKGGEGVKESLTSEDIDRCNKAVEDFVYSQDPTKAMQVMADRLMINQCFYHFKHLYKDIMKKKGGAGDKDGKYSGPNFGNAPLTQSPSKGGDKASAAQNEEQTAEI
jgi:hypothetical protein